jgi:hypothetical protein
MTVAIVLAALALVAAWLAARAAGKSRRLALAAVLRSPG